MDNKAQSRPHIKTFTKRSITDVFIKHPVIAVVVNLVLVLMGARAMMMLPVQQYPDIQSSSVVITTVFTGASAETVRGFLTTPIEHAVSAISGIDYIESQSSAGLSNVTAHLKLNHNSTAALAEVTARLQQVRSELPEEAEPSVVEVQRADRPYAAFYISFDSNQRSISTLTDWLTRTLQPQLSTISGVQRVTIEAGQPIAMCVWIDPDRLAALNLSATDVYQALRRNNYLSTMGRTKSNLIQVNLLANTDLRSIDEFNDLIVADRGGAIVRLSDVARVELGAEEAEMIGKHNEIRGVYLGVWPLVGSNEIDVAKRLRSQMDRIQQTLPEDITMNLAWDGTMFMREALSEITKTLIETIIIVGIVVFFFMGSVRTALVPLFAMPISLIGASVVMLAFGFSLNLLTILALVLSVGLVVDDAIVMVENVERHVQLGKSRLEAALAGSRELIAPILTMTITLAVVYFPIALQGGLTGSLFLEFAITLVAAVVVSGFVAMTLSPVMSSRFVHPHGKEDRLTVYINRSFTHISRAYAWLLDRAMTMRWAFVMAAVVITMAAWPLYQQSRRELAPVEDQSHVGFFFLASPDATLKAVNSESLNIVRAITAFPETNYVWSLTAPWGGFGGMVAKNWKERERSTEQMYGDIFAALSQVPGLRVFPHLDPPLPTPGKYDVEILLQSDVPPKQLLETAMAVIDAGWQSGKFLYIDTDLKIDLPQAQVVMDRERLADLGLDIASVSHELGTMFGGAYVNHFNYFDRSYKVIPQIGDYDRRSINQLLDLKIKIPSGDFVPVSSFTTIESKPAPRSLNRFQQCNAVRIFGGVLPDVTKEEGLRVLEAAKETACDPDVTLDYAGESRQIRQEEDSLIVTLGFAIILIYLMLSAQFHCFRDPLIVLLGSVPLAISGALVFSYFNLTTINIYSQIGLITLVGLIAKNGILIVEFANRLQMRGMSKKFAIREASLTRLRPVLMTTAATVFGHFPLVIVSGPGAEARNSIGTVLVAGMILGTLFTLFVVPVFYSLIATRQRQDFDQVQRGYKSSSLWKDDGTDGRRKKSRLPSSDALDLLSDFSSNNDRRINRRKDSTDDQVNFLPSIGSQLQTHVVGSRKKRWPRILRWLAGFLFVFLVLAGCTVGPQYRRPAVSCAQTWRDGQSSVESLANLDWWELFQDEELYKLIEIALEANKELQIAVARIDQARAKFGTVRAGMLPEINAVASAARKRDSENSTYQEEYGVTDLFSANVDFTFELDLWGRLRRASEAARAELISKEEARCTVVMMLVSKIATNYFQLRQLDLERDVTLRNVATRRDSLELVRKRHAAGLTSILDLRQAEAALAGTAAQIPKIEQRIVKTENQLSILLGRIPAKIKRGLPLSGQTFPPNIPSGLPSTLLERRPDIRQAEQELIAANARVGVAKAAFFPQIRITGLYGAESTLLSDLFTKPSRMWRFGLDAIQPIYNAGRNRANLELVWALHQEHLIRYENVILQAFKEVEDALITHHKARESLIEQRTAVRTSREAMQIAEFRYASGLTSYINVLEAQRTLLTEEVEESRTLLTQLVAVVQIYRALGGGWTTF